MSAVGLPLWRQHAHALWQLSKPRVVALIVFCAVIGMFLASPGVPDAAVVVPATLGIALVAGAAAMVNCLVERGVDVRMRRTAWRATATGEVGARETLLVALAVGGMGLALLLACCNALTAWLTLGTFVGYAIVYTLLLKPNTPQNIVIGGASGAMPPVLGWTAVNGQIDAFALALFLIIYTWTPPHFWALALYRRDDYARAGLPMLPVTHGQRYTTLSIVLYGFLLTAVTLLPVALGEAGAIYLGAVLLLDGRLLFLAVRLHRQYADALARRLFAWSIWYLTWLFAALLLDHYYLIPLN
ncbi:heme o synthase [Chromobacterium violaceum]|uniref:Protoheme IX farnesyltransferase 1 n=2 Tax=Chromobacterium violaceum TaxID=536 RepID=COXX1_CHRVO|nr:heme o synthase [Chromobacterium violaceum]Q7P0G0.1 RecName: Full=Protoheme IX farnesyltransferase 1; AltName: Full=Heme B farnesyltransferase 1; AltName: Full=Heme O synthase 1 [Chromobacterium violaceum ATCC 12472]AAQ58283.1 protoheme IX farnesyltransferase [Chromobacterium violaceum ATCC 12472]KJH65799.1 protoheme IX farnesyltransferase [Chromobacterium violaceum]KMN50809.1 protoheme IX farnesyltransferase [Chromobacterium violaceum]KMN85300.1 protoheme IX farnesyltransferase [Chromobact